MPRAITTVLTAFLLLTLTACTAPVTVESLETARESGPPPTIESVEYTGIVGVSMDWTPEIDARGWQVQYSFDGGATWVEETSENMLGEDSAQYGGSDVQWGADDGTSTTAIIRLRKVIDGSTVSPWATYGPIATANVIGTSCLAAFKSASKQARDDGGESELERTLDVCASQSEWILAVQMFPGVVGLTVATESDATSSFGIACRSYSTRRLCS